MSLSLLRARFPALADWIEAAPGVRVELLSGPAPALRLDGVQLASRHDPRAEAELQARLVPAGAARATLYGFAQGELVRVLLARPGLRALRVVVLAPAAAREVFALGQADWLADERVELVHRPAWRNSSCPSVPLRPTCAWPATRPRVCGTSSRSNSRRR